MSEARNSRLTGKEMARLTRAWDAAEDADKDLASTNARYLCAWMTRVLGRECTPGNAKSLADTLEIQLRGAKRPGGGGGSGNLSSGMMTALMLDELMRRLGEDRPLWWQTFVAGNTPLADIRRLRNEERRGSS